MTSAGFYLMGQKGLSCLEAALDLARTNEDFSIAYVVDGSDAQVANDYFDEVESLAVQNNIIFYDRTRTGSLPKADLLFAIGWRWLIKEDMNKLIVFHDSLLPKYRGFNPLVTALIEGDDQIGVTAIRAGVEFDRGNIIGVKKTTVGYPLKIQEAIGKISLLYGELLTETINGHISGTLSETAQDENSATYSLWRDDEDYRIDWSQPADRIARFIDAVGFPYNGATTLCGETRIRIQDATPAGDLLIVNRTPGKLIFAAGNSATVVCGTGLLKINDAIDDAGRPVEFKKIRIRLT
jgi:methionyl-tRNA formyltransferase